MQQNSKILCTMASTFAAFFKRYKFIMAAKELAIFSAQFSVDK